MVEEAKNMAAQYPSGEYVYRVRGPPREIKILKFRKKVINKTYLIDKLDILYTNADGLLKN